MGKLIHAVNNVTIHSYKTLFILNGKIRVRVY
jgi:hypothetical protein